MKKKTKIFLLEFLILIVIGSFYSKLLISFIWAILHEIAHIFIARCYDVKLGDIEINVTGVSTYGYELEDLNYKKRIRVFLAGPLFNFISFFPTSSARNRSLSTSESGLPYCAQRFAGRTDTIRSSIASTSEKFIIPKIAPSFTSAISERNSL